MTDPLPNTSPSIPKPVHGAIDAVPAQAISAATPDVDPSPVPAPASAGETESVGEQPAGKPTQTTPSKKAPGLGPRWSFLITRGLVIALVWAFFTYAFDPLVKYVAVQSGQATTGAKVDIETLTTGFFPPVVTVTGVEIANAQKRGINLFAFEKMDGDVDGLALLKGSYIVDKAVVSGVTWNTPRDDDGMLEDVEPPEEDTEGGDFAAQVEEFGKEWANDLLKRAQLEYDPRNLETVRLADQLEDEWKADFDGLEFQIKQIDGNYRKLEDLFKQAKGGKPLEKLDQYRRLTEDAGRLLREVSTIRKELEQLPGKAKVDLTDLNGARQRDQAEIERKVKELVLDGDKLSEFLLGPTLHHRVKQTVSWIQWANRRLDKFRSDTKPVRLRGEDILFEREVVLPKYLVRLMEVSGQGKIGGDQLDVSGTIQHVTTEPKLYGKPITINLEGHGDAELLVRGELDRTGDAPVNRINVLYELPDPVTNRLGDEDTLIVQVVAQRTTWHAEIETVGDTISGRILMKQDPVILTSEMKKSSDERLKRVLSASVAQVEKVEATIQLSGTVKRPQWKIRTNLGDQR